MYVCTVGLLHYYYHGTLVFPCTQTSILHKPEILCRLLIVVAVVPKQEEK